MLAAVFGIGSGLGKICILPIRRFAFTSVNILAGKGVLIWGSWPVVFYGSLASIRIGLFRRIRHADGDDGIAFRVVSFPKRIGQPKLPCLAIPTLALYCSRAAEGFGEMRTPMAFSLVRACWASGVCGYRWIRLRNSRAPGSR